jgi:hypothetical protein
MDPAIRLTFAFDSRGPIQFVEHLRLSKRFTLPDRSLLVSEPQSGFWVELRDARNELIYQRVMDDPTQRFEGPPRPDERTESGSGTGLMSVVVPDIAAAARLIIMASRPPDARAAAIADVDLKALV